MGGSGQAWPAGRERQNLLPGFRLRLNFSLQRAQRAPPHPRRRRLRGAPAVPVLDGPIPPARHESRNPLDCIQALAIGQVNRYIKELIASDEILNDVWIRGEVLDCTRHGSGHLFFTLKDSEAELRCVMWRSSAVGLRFAVEAGVQVVAYGSVSVYEKRGYYQFQALHLEPDGQGARHLALERLKHRLEAEGLFDPVRKRPLPLLPRRVALVTSRNGAAVQDLIRIIQTRHPEQDLVVVPAKVQGDGAPDSLVRSLGVAARLPDVEVIIVGRGGGSAEDLWAFNDERVARAIFASPVPVVSAVGHEIDTCIADLVADLRAPTPSAAAAAVVPDTAELRMRLDEMEGDLGRRLAERLSLADTRLRRLIDRPILSQPQALMESRSLCVQQLRRRMAFAARRRLEAGDGASRALAARLDALSPLSVLARGYAVLM